jgi:heme-degrading monooxygenase HmoA
MIARTWHGRTDKTRADEYQEHYDTQVREQLQQIPGFRGARLLRRDIGEEVEFTSITYFTTRDDVYAFAGESPDNAVVEEGARRVLTRWDQHVIHHEVAVDIQP